MPVLNRHRTGMPAGSIYIGRGSRWGNPFVIGTHGTRDEVCDAYEQLLWNQIQAKEVSLEDVAALHNQQLVCFCKPARCHGDTLEKAALWALKQLGRNPEAVPAQQKFTFTRT